MYMQLEKIIVSELGTILDLILNKRKCINTSLSGGQHIRFSFREDSNIILSHLSIFYLILFPFSIY